MNISPYLVSALENVLGKGYKRSRGNIAFMCPWCCHRKPKLEINLDSDSSAFGCWECWVCGTKGRSVESLLRHLHLNSEERESILQYVNKGDNKTFFETKTISLPEEYTPLLDASDSSYEVRRFKSYLHSRGLTDEDFVRYDIGYCTHGKFEGRVIIPSYGEHNILNYFVARSLDPGAYMKYMNPDVSKDIIYFENLINWQEPVLICEGVFDALALRRNSTCLLGKRMSPSLLKKLIENPVPAIYMILDQDALKASVENCEKLLGYGKKVYLVIPPKKDPSESGFEEVTKTLQSARELTFEDLVRYRLEI